MSQSGIKEEIKRNTWKQMKNTTIQNLWDTAKAVIRGNYKQNRPTFRSKKSQTPNLTLHLKNLEQQMKPKAMRREIIKISAEINDIETNKQKTTIEQIKENRRGFFEKINEIDKPLARFIKKKEESIKINKITREEK